MLHLDPTPRVLRQFGVLSAMIFGGIAAAGAAGWGVASGRPWLLIALASIALFSALFSMVAPRANRPLYLALTLVTYPMGWLVSTLVLLTLFALVLTPLALWRRATGRSVVSLAPDEAAATYWTPSPPPRPTEDYFEQY